MNDSTLDQLIKLGIILDYEYFEENENGERVTEDHSNRGNSRNTEIVILYFPGGVNLRIGTFCAGSSENTILDFVKDYDKV